MMMGGEKKGIGAILMAPSKAGPVAGEAEGGDALDIPAQDLIAAVKAGDTEGVKSALRAAYSACSMETEGPEA